MEDPGPFCNNPRICGIAPPERSAVNDPFVFPAAYASTQGLTLPVMTTPSNSSLATSPTKRPFLRLSCRIAAPPSELVTGFAPYDGIFEYRAEIPVRAAVSRATDPIAYSLSSAPQEPRKSMPGVIRKEVLGNCFPEGSSVLWVIRDRVPPWSKKLQSISVPEPAAPRGSDGMRIVNRNLWRIITRSRQSCRLRRYRRSFGTAPNNRQMQWHVVVTPLSIALSLPARFERVM